jgi:rare lipoprotein A
MTAAHKTLPFNVCARVDDPASGRSVVVRINDRGPFERGRVIDLSRAAAAELGILGSGLARVRVEAIGVAATDGRCGAA